MKITCTPNPLNTIIELDDHEKEVFKLKLRIEAYEDMLFSAHWSLTRSAEYLAGLPRPKTIEEARAAAIEELDPEYWCAENNKLDARVEELLQHYIEELKSNHVGDCTCCPASCSKCHAESMIGINTIKGLGKHSAHKIESVFSRWNPETQQHDRPEVSLVQALEKLRTFQPKATWEGWEAHAERWAKEANAAYEWLKAYQEQHFPDLDVGIGSHE